MGAELSRFEKDLRRIENLQYALVYADQNKGLLKRQLEKASADPTSGYFGVRFNDFISDLVEGFSLGEIVLLRRAVEHYTSEIHQGNDWRRQSDIKRRCPSFGIRFHKDCEDIHVIDLSKELRDIIIHPLGPEHYRLISRKDMSPMAILQQEVALWSNPSSRRKILILRGLDNKQDYLDKWQLLPPGFSHSRADLFSGILFTEVMDCIRTYDSIREVDLDKAIKYSKEAHPPIEYL